ncbi:MAG: hybrid sensor histidine kinase/response regulator [Rhodothermales bacterium]
MIAFHLLIGLTGLMDAAADAPPTLVGATLFAVAAFVALCMARTTAPGEEREVESDAAPTKRRSAPGEPRATRRRRIAVPAEDERAPRPGPAADRHTVLVVDDNATVIRFVERALGDAFTVISARNGREALEVAAGAIPDLIISDIMMPVMDGHELCRTVKDDPVLRHIPVVLLTALVSQNDLIEGLELGSDDYIFKPFNARELKARVRNLIAAREEQRRLAIENRELVSVSERKSDLINIAAHDLKNPLTAIRELADILKEEVGEHSEAFEPADLIHHSSDQMLALIASLLESEAIEDGRIPLHPQSMDLTEAAADVVRRNDFLAGRKGQTIELTLPSGDAGERLHVYADPHLLVEAMDNLINNAVKYSPPGATVRVRVRSDKDDVLFSVEDEGPGIPSDEQHLLFQKFQPLSTQPTAGETSTGLGLSIVKQIVDLHEGTIEVRSAPGAGSTFSIRLPAELAHWAVT